MNSRLEGRRFRPDQSASGLMAAHFTPLRIYVWGDPEIDRFRIMLDESNASIEAVLCRDDMVTLRDRITEVLEATQ